MYFFSVLFPHSRLLGLDGNCRYHSFTVSLNISSMVVIPFRAFSSPSSNRVFMPCFLATSIISSSGASFAINDPIFLSMANISNIPVLPLYPIPLQNLHPSPLKSFVSGGNFKRLSNILISQVNQLWLMPPVPHPWRL